MCRLHGVVCVLCGMRFIIPVSMALLWAYLIIGNKSPKLIQVLVPFFMKCGVEVWKTVDVRENNNPAIKPER